MTSTVTTDALAAAIKSAYKDEARITQDELADRLGLQRGQGMVSRWARGEVTPDVWTIARIEQACGLPAGWIFRRAGFIDDDVEAVISAAPGLDAEKRRRVLSFYRYVRDGYDG